MLYRIKFAEWNLHGDDKQDIKQKIDNFIKNRISPKIELIEEQTKDDYIERIMTEDDRLRSLKYRTINNLIKE